MVVVLVVVVLVVVIVLGGVGNVGIDGGLSDKDSNRPSQSLAVIKGEKGSTGTSRGDTGTTSYNNDVIFTWTGRQWKSSRESTQM